MKKLLVFCLTAFLIISSLTACNMLDDIFGGKSGVSKEYYENCAVFTFDGFESRICITLDRTGLGEGTIYYQVNLEEGALSVKYSDVDLINENQPLSEFAADDEMPLVGSGGYIEGDKIAITFEAFSPVKGEIIIAFTEDALKAVHGNLQLHKHTGEWHTSESTHYYQYTCGCPSPDIAELHSDYDENFICDICEYIMNGHEHLYEYYHDDIGHGWSYTCGCKTPPNFAQHFDGDGNGRCDENFCEYHMVSYSISYDEKIALEFLMDGYAPTEAKPGNTVQLRTHPIMDADLVFYANGVKLTQTHADSDYWEYIFTMPNENVVITHEIVGDGPAPANHFLRNVAGCEWLNEITAEDIAEIKIISEAVGVAPGNLKNISSSTDTAVIARIFEAYYWLDTTPISKTDGQIDGGSGVTVKFILKDGPVKELYVNNGNYRDTDGNYFDLLYTPKLTEEMNPHEYCGFITYVDKGIVYKKNAIGSYIIPSEAIGEIDIGSLEFKYDVDIDFVPPFDPNAYGVTVYTEFGKLKFVTPDIFIYDGFYCTLVGKSIEDLINTNGVTALINAHEAKYNDGRVASVELYYGEYSSGAVVGMIVDDKTAYTEALWSETVSGYCFEYWYGNRIVVLFDGEFYTLGEALDNGCLTKYDIALIWSIHNY